MRALSQAQIKRLTAIHGWSAVVLGLLLYAVVATGAVAVFANEIGRWSVGAPREAPPLDGPSTPGPPARRARSSPSTSTTSASGPARAATCTSSSTPMR